MNLLIICSVGSLLLGLWLMRTIGMRRYAKMYKELIDINDQYQMATMVANRRPSRDKERIRRILNNN